MSYRIITDTCCDLWQQFYKELNTEVISLSVNFKGQTYDSYTETWLKDFLQRASGRRGGADRCCQPRGLEIRN